MTLTASAAHSHSLYFSRAAASTSPHTVPVASFAASRRRRSTPPRRKRARSHRTPPPQPLATAIASTPATSSIAAIAERRHCILRRHRQQLLLRALLPPPSKKVTEQTSRKAVAAATRGEPTLPARTHPRRSVFAQLLVAAPNLDDGTNPMELLAACCSSPLRSVPSLPQVIVFVYPHLISLGN